MVSGFREFLYQVLQALNPLHTLPNVPLIRKTTWLKAHVSEGHPKIDIQNVSQQPLYTLACMSAGGWQKTS